MHKTDLSFTAWRIAASSTHALAEHTEYRPTGSFLRFFPTTVCSQAQGEPAIGVSSESFIEMSLSYSNPPVPPTAQTERAPAATPARADASIEPPWRKQARKPASKLSPAPVVSTTRVLIAGTRNCRPSA